MGRTIHYQGKLVERARLADMLDAAREYCAEQRWACLEIDERLVGQVERMRALDLDPSDRLEGDSKAALDPLDDSLQGLRIVPLPEAEPFWLTFNDAGELAYYAPLDDVGGYREYKTLSTGTLYARLDTHVAVCEFLHWLQDNFMPGLNVYDEGGYFESGDWMSLEQIEDSSDPGDAWHLLSDHNDSEASEANSLPSPEIPAMENRPPGTTRAGPSRAARKKNTRRPRPPK